MYQQEKNLRTLMLSFHPKEGIWRLKLKAGGQKQATNYSKALDRTIYHIRLNESKPHFTC